MSSSAATRQICIPVIQPASGTFSPPLLVTCVADLQSFEELWVVITTPKQRISQLYKSPFMVDEVGRIQIQSFVRRPGVCDGPASNAIFELSLNAPPLGKGYAASLVRGVNTNGSGIMGASFMGGGANATFVNHGLNMDSSLSGGAAAQQLLASAIAAGGVMGHTSVMAPHLLRGGAGSGPAALAIPTCQFTSAGAGIGGAAAGFGAGSAIPPHSLQSLKPTDLAISVCDTSGSPIALMDPPTSAVVVLDVPEFGAVLTCKANLEVYGTEAEKVLPSFQSLSDLLVSRESPSAANNNLPSLSLGKTSSRADAGGALGITGPEIGVLSTARGCGVMFRVNNVFVGAVGVDEPQNADDVRRNVRKDIAHAFHFTGDVSISNAGEGLYKIADRTEPTRSIETRSYRVGDCFSLTMRPSGDIDYIHNDRIVFTSRAKSGIETLLSTIVRIASEGGAAPCIGDIALVPPRADQRYVIPSLIYNGPSGEGVLRVWLSGREFAPATAKVRLTSSSLPRWAFSTFSVATMFAVGAFGCDGAKVAEAMVATESETLQLFQKDPSGATGQQYAVQKQEKSMMRGATNNKSYMTDASDVSVGYQQQQQQQQRQQGPSSARPSGGGGGNNMRSFIQRGQRDQQQQQQSFVNEVVTRGPAGSGDDGSSWENANKSAAAIASNGMPRQYPTAQQRAQQFGNSKFVNSSQQQQMVPPSSSGATSSGASALPPALESVLSGSRVLSSNDHRTNTYRHDPQANADGEEEQYHNGNNRYGNRNAAENPFIGIGAAHGAVNPIDMLAGGGGVGGHRNRPATRGGGMMTNGSAADDYNKPMVLFDNNGNAVVGGGGADRDDDERSGIMQGAGAGGGGDGSGSDIGLGGGAAAASSPFDYRPQPQAPFSDVQTRERQGVVEMGMGMGGGRGGGFAAEDASPVPPNPSNRHQQQQSYMYQQQPSSRLDNTFSAGNNPNFYSGADLRSGSLASLASNKRRALDAVFD